jgi:hypothetical protein
VTDIVLRLETLISRARRGYEERFRTLPDEAKQAIITALTARPQFSFDHDEPYECPACGNQAWLGGITETRWDLDTIDTPYGEAGRPVVVFYPNFLRCSACDLELHGEALHHTDIEEMIELPDAEPDIPEPDLDWLPDMNESDEH